MYLIICIILLAFACTFSFKNNGYRYYNKLYSRSSHSSTLQLSQQTNVKECNTWMQYAINANENNNNQQQSSHNHHKQQHHNVKQVIVGKTFFLMEILNGEEVQSLVDFIDNGSITFFTPDRSSIKNIKGSWIESKNNVLKMVIERVYQGKKSEYAVKSYYVGVIENINSDIVAIGGEICDEICDLDNREPSEMGKFLLTKASASGDDSTSSTYTDKKYIKSSILSISSSSTQ